MPVGTARHLRAAHAIDEDAPRFAAARLDAAGLGAWLRRARRPRLESENRLYLRRALKPRAVPSACP